ncbi:MAG: AMP-binding protein, partial [Bacteroidales bacterium]|nr:AMP-binding protein [Bacteroidales bacterium]
MRHNFDSLADVFAYSTKKYAKRPAFSLIGEEQQYSYAGFSEICRRQARLLSNFGISTGDKVAILSQNMPNW